MTPVFADSVHLDFDGSKVCVTHFVPELSLMGRGPCPMLIARVSHIGQNIAHGLAKANMY